MEVRRHGDLNGTPEAGRASLADGHDPRSRSPRATDPPALRCGVRPPSSTSSTRRQRPARRARSSAARARTAATSLPGRPLSATLRAFRDLADGRVRAARAAEDPLAWFELLALARAVEVVVRAERIAAYATWLAVSATLTLDVAAVVSVPVGLGLAASRNEGSGRHHLGAAILGSNVGSLIFPFSNLTNLILVSTTDVRCSSSASLSAETLVWCLAGAGGRRAGVAGIVPWHEVGSATVSPQHPLVLMSAIMVNVRSMVDDVAAAVAIYATSLGFVLQSDAGTAFASVTRGPLRLLVSGSTSSASRPMPDGQQPGPGGWNRVQLVVEDLPAEIKRLRAAGISFRNNVVTGPGGQQILVEDPSGKLVEQFAPAR